ncbi:MAG: GSCFA domain-containing protein [Muribaculaceae bacterium]|nr:GSCFA domain-containing protein [Muribaculaceae bacterium]
MKFRTEYEAHRCTQTLNPEETAVLIGSCFTDYIGARMRQCRWRAFPNITGTLYNPASIANTLRIATAWDNIFDCISESTIQNDRLWVSWLTDSGSTTYDRNDTKDRVFDRFLRLHNHLKEAHTLIVTFGTAWVYELRERPGYIVANCHRFPAGTFIRRRLKITEIADEWNQLIKLLSNVCPDLRIIFTVSPVRHLKDGFEGNSRSKAVLQLACEMAEYVGSLEKYKAIEYYNTFISAHPTMLHIDE